MFRVNGASPSEQPNKPERSEQGSSTQNASEINIFSDSEGYEKTVGYVAAHDGGADSTKLDGKDAQKMIDMLNEKYNEFKGMLSDNVVKIIKENIDNLKNTKRNADKKYMSYLVNIQKQSKAVYDKKAGRYRTQIEMKLDKIRNPETCEYYISLLDEMYDEAWDLAKLGDLGDGQQAFTNAQNINTLRNLMKIRLETLTGLRDENGQIIAEVYFDD